MLTKFIGIDPGSTGAVAVLCPELDYAQVYDLPFIETKTKSKKRKSGFKTRRTPDHVGIARLFSLILTQHDKFDFESKFDLVGRDVQKKDSVYTARILYPGLVNSLKRIAIDHNRAEAILIAHNSAVEAGYA